MLSTEPTQSANYGVLLALWCEPGQVVWICKKHNSFESDGSFQLTDTLLVVVQNHGLVYVGKRLTNIFLLTPPVPDCQEIFMKTIGENLEKMKFENANIAYTLKTTT